MKTIHLSAISRSNNKSKSLRIGLETEDGIHSPLCYYEGKNIEPDHFERIKKECLNTIKRLNTKTHRIAGFKHHLESLGDMLCQELLTPNIVLKIMRSDASFLILHIDDTFVHIPWELILIENQFLCERFNIGRLVNTRQKLINIPIDSDRTLPITMSILANPDGDLENADEESEKLIENMDQLNDDKNEFIINASSYGHFSLKDTLSLIRNSDFFHFAGHAVYHSENYRKSGWLLGDDFLTAGDINKMFASSMPVLVFSNACQSARTEEWMPEYSNKDYSGLLNDSKQFKSIDQVLKKERSVSPERFVENQSFEIETFDLDENFGLVNAFLRSGVKFYIGTNWKILDEPGSRFAIYFYTNFLRGLSIGESIKKARLSCLEKYGPDSIDWASYVLYGDPRFSLKYMHAKNLDIAKERRVDAIAPEYAEINNQIDLVVQVRLFDSPVLSFEDIPIKHKPHSVAQGSETIELEFPVKPDGQIESACIKIKVITIHFTITNGNEKSLKIPPHKDSKRVFFYLIAKQVGNCRINIELSSYGKTYLGNIPIEINVSDQPSLDIVPLTLNSLSFMFRVADGNIKHIGSYLYEKVPENFRFEKKKSNEAINKNCEPVVRLNQKILPRGAQNRLLNRIENLNSNFNLKWVTGITGLILLFLIFFIVIEIMLHPPQSFDVNQICENEEIQQELIHNKSEYKTDRLKKNNVACDTNSSVTGVSIKFDSNFFVDSGHHAIRKVIMDSSIVTIAGGDKAEKLEVELNKYSVETGAEALGTSEFVARSNDTSLSSSKPGTIIGQVGFASYDHFGISSTGWNLISSLGIEYTNNNIHGTPKMIDVKFIVKPFKGINNSVGAGARALGVTRHVGRYVAIADDATAASWNPGGLNQIPQVEYNHIFNMSGSLRSNTTWNVAGKTLGFEYTHINNQEILKEFKLVPHSFDLYSKRPFSLNEQYRSKLEKTLKSISENIQQFEHAYDLNIKPIFNHKWKYNFTKNRWEFHSRFKYTFN